MKAAKQKGEESESSGEKESKSCGEKESESSGEKKRAKMGDAEWVECKKRPQKKLDCPIKTCAHTENCQMVFRKIQPCHTLKGHPHPAINIFKILEKRRLARFMSLAATAV